MQQIVKSINFYVKLIISHLQRLSIRSLAIAMTKARGRKITTSAIGVAEIINGLAAGVYYQGAYRS